MILCQIMNQGVNHNSTTAVRRPPPVNTDLKPWFYLSGMYPNAPKPPCVLGYEASGVVTKLGEGSEGFKVTFLLTRRLSP